LTETPPVRTDQSEITALAQIARLLRWILVALVIAFCFFASSVCITLVLAALLTILVTPLVRTLEQLRVPRPLAAASVILVGVLGISFLLYGSYNRLNAFSEQIPEYVERIRQATSPINDKLQQVQDSAGTLAHGPAPKRIPEVRIRETTSWASYLVRGVGSIWGALIIAGVVPFLMFFMLLADEKLNVCLKNMFGRRVDIERLLLNVQRMVRAYAAGNLMIGAVLAAISILVFWWIGLKPAILLGVLSGMLNLIPFLGIIVALAVPEVAGFFQFNSAGPFLIIGLTVVILHLLSANFLIPRFVGSRVDLGPVAATVGLLFWGWLWGIAGLLLAIPLTAFLKLLADSDPSFVHLSNLLARQPRRFVVWRRRSHAGGSAVLDISQQL
jgi:predicted PurR-regulated permease PerM